MRRGFALGLVGLVVALACDDAHKVGDDIGVGGRGGATGGKSAKGGGTSTVATGSAGVGGSPTNGGAVGSGGAIATSGGSPIVGGGGAVGKGGSTIASGSAGGTASTSIGGTAGAGVVAGGPSILDETCNWPSVHFEFTVDDPSLYCYHPDFVTPNYSVGGIRILTPDGQAVTNLGARNSEFARSCNWPRCSTCNYCSSGADPSQYQVTSEAKTGTWDGGFDLRGTCGGSSMTCYANRCVQPGRFIAKYCVAPKGVWSSCNVGDPRYFFAETACVEVPFDFPTTEVVRGQITTPTMGGAGGAGPVGTGGTVSNGGAAGGPAIVDETCTRPAAQFEFTVDEPSKYCSSGYWGRGSIEILDGDGQAVRNLGPDVCSPVSCASCDRTYPAGTCVTLAPVQGDAGSTPLTEAWDGSFNLSGTCGNPSADCVAHQCVQPGRFRAKYCLAPKGNLSTCTELDPSKFLPATACVEVPFDYPTTEVIHGQITTPGTGGAGAGGAGGAGAAGAPTCLPGCNLESKSSQFCPSERSHAWVCGASPNVSTQMLAAGCTDAATGAIRYCCPSTFQTQCQ